MKAISLMGIVCLSLSSLALEKKALGKEPRSSRERREDKTKGHLLADPLFTTGKKKNETSGIGVNTYLWKASLETIAFLPKKSIDPFGGTLITEWYSFPETPHERLKIEIIVAGRALTSDGVKVSIFREKKNTRGEWVSAPLEADTTLKFEETILTRARELKVAEEIN